MAAPPLKTDPKWGYFPRWPQDGNDWLHPDDVSLARTLIPSTRIFRRDGTEGEYSLLHYGEMTIRALLALWQEVSPEDLEIGDWVEVLSRGMQYEPRTGIVREVRWNEATRAIGYQIEEAGQPIEQFYSRDDLQRIDRV